MSGDFLAMSGEWLAATIRQVQAMTDEELENALEVYDALLANLPASAVREYDIATDTQYIMRMDQMGRRWAKEWGSND